jgi:phosphatidate cytidylyltransferase
VIGVKKKYFLVIPAYLFSLTFPIVAFFVKSGDTRDFLVLIAALLFAYMIYLMAVAVFSKGNLSFAKMAESYTAVTYVSVSYTSLSLIRYLKADVGVYYLMLVFIVAWMCDACAYLIGSLFGKHKLIPEISPKKTVEGAIGGVVFGAISFIVYGFILDSFIPNMVVNYPFLALFGTVLALVSQIGDLVASLLKREYGAKDYGNILPGHGGIVDRFDSILAISTVLMTVCMVFPPFN